jgi:hypothetical protein
MEIDDQSVAVCENDTTMLRQNGIECTWWMDTVSMLSIASKEAHAGEETHTYKRRFCNAEPRVCAKGRNGRDFGSQPRTGFAPLHLLLTTQHIMFSLPNLPLRQNCKYSFWYSPLTMMMNQPKYICKFNMLYTDIGNIYNSDSTLSLLPP